MGPFALQLQMVLKVYGNSITRGFLVMAFSDSRMHLNADFSARFQMALNDGPIQDRVPIASL
jgi:hypothetical protein